MLAVAGPFVDFATVNVSSPNTERLRELQGRAALAALLAGVMAANAGLARPVPVFLKIAPDLDDRALAEIVEAALDGGVAGIVATNTTLARDGLTSRHAARGRRPLRAAALRPLDRRARQAPRDDRGPAAADRRRRRRHARAGLRQDPRRRLGACSSTPPSSTTGLGLVPRLLAGLDRLLARDGFATVAEAVGTGRREWLAG